MSQGWDLAGIATAVKAEDERCAVSANTPGKLGAWMAQRPKRSRFGGTCSKRAIRVCAYFLGRARPVSS